MPKLTNSWVGYITRTYEQIKAQVITNMQSRVPEITDHTEGNIFVKMIGIWGGIAEMLGYYIDNAAREAHISTCRLYSSAVKLAKIVDYRIKSAVPATADVLFTINNTSLTTINIPIRTLITTDDGVEFFTTEASTIPIGSTTATVPVEQAGRVLGVILNASDGTADQQLSIIGIFGQFTNMVDGSSVVSVNGVAWTQKTTFGFSLPADQHYVQTVDENMQPIIRFGNGINGKIPPAGASIEINSYRYTSGPAGNVPASTITNIASGFITLPTGISITATNPERAANGVGVESLDQLKHRIPLATRTLMRAVTYDDYRDVAEIAAGVALAGVIFDCGKYVEVYIVPDGGGIASGSLITNTTNWFEDKRMLTTQVAVKAAGEVHIQLNIDLRVKPGYQRSTVAAAVSARLADYISYKYQVIGGTTHLSDIYEWIEETEGVDWSDIKIMTPVPYARPLNTTVHVLNWSRAVQALSTTTIRWEIRMTSSTTFQLIKDTSFIGNFTVGVLVSLPEIKFTILAGTYAINDQWEFYSYPYFGTLVLREASVPVSLIGDITINATGGI